MEKKICRTVKVSAVHKNFNGILKEDENIERNLSSLCEDMDTVLDVKVNDMSVVYYAAEKKLNDLLNDLLARNLRRMSDVYDKALYLAVENANVDGMMICYAFGGNPGAFRNYALRYILMNESYLENAIVMFKFLVEHGADVNEDPELLQLASYNGLTEYVKILFANGQKPYFDMKCFPRYETPLCLAAKRKENLEVAKVLIENGCDLSQANYAAVKVAFERYNLQRLYWIVSRKI